MLKTTDTHQEFEDIARRLFQEHPEVPHRWCQVNDASGGRTDLVCWPETTREVYASLTNYQITIGTAESNMDFEDFGRGLSDKVQEARAWRASINNARNMASPNQADLVKALAEVWGEIREEVSNLEGKLVRNLGSRIRHLVGTGSIHDSARMLRSGLGLVKNADDVEAWLKAYDHSIVLNAWLK